MRIRFSIRRLLVAFVVVAACCWWWDRPRRTANSLAAAMEAGDVEAVNRLLERMKFAGTPARMEVVARKQSAIDWLRGISRLTVAVDIGEVLMMEFEVHRHKAVRAPRLPDATSPP